MSWNDNVKKIIDFIPQFEQIQKDVNEFAKRKFATDFDDSEIKKEICEIKNKIAGLCNYDDKSIFLKLDSLALSLSKIKDFDDSSIKKEIDAIAKDLKSIKPFDDSEIKKDMLTLQKQFDSSRRSFSELYEQKIALVTKEQQVAIESALLLLAEVQDAKHFDDSELKESIVKIKSTIGGLKNYDDKLILSELSSVRSSILEQGEQISRLTIGNAKMQKEINDFKTAFGS